ncbi:hypothetical protein [Erythrobacter sp. THAF29]|uniref:hypothetical protein n=1 Tax=Erythrobacter sp. THAF29 TaxID=2587851 RepID=UPI0012A9F0E7|nr:hypothetical protein [Erythrobacter sp. THAF29]QFT78457.1 hypothetical protein FIU90_12975 [Erythrobacter sp. THAF29]
MLLAAISSFAIGGLLVGYVVWYNVSEQEAVDTRQPAALASTSPTASPTGALSPSPTPLASPSETASAEEAVEAVTGLAEQQGGLDQRLAAAEQRLARLDLQAQAAAGNAARAEALLIAFATRRVIERGDELGYLADQLRLRFGDERPNAVNTIINFSRIDPPIRLDTLLARLEGLGPQLAERDEGPSWASFKRELSELFVIRRRSTPSPQPERRLERARYALEQGRYQNAIDEIRNMPGAEKAEAWIADAEKFRDVMAALENIETAAVLDQRGLRDGAGNRIEQPSPVGTSGGE